MSKRPTREEFKSIAFALLNETDPGLRLPKDQQAKGYRDGCYIGLSFGIDRVYEAIEIIEFRLNELENVRWKNETF